MSWRLKIPLFVALGLYYIIRFMRKGDIVEGIFVETMAAEGKCVGKLNGQVVFLEGCAPGDVVDAQLTKIKLRSQG
jgi:23S rRNA (uracil1939-C5)-methyltransferase